jgi:hypothetical protein
MALPTTSAARWHALTIGLIIGTAVCHIGYLCCDCPLDLSPDEAHYWDWSRWLDASYYSKGPLVAYLIRASCEAFGPAAQRLVGSPMPAVRLPAVLCGSLLLASLYVLTLQVYGRPRLGAAVVALALTLPLISVGSTLMTIDAPYTCCWGWALVAVHRAIFRGSHRAWVAAGLFVGLGILAKYTMVLWLVSVGLFLLATPGYRGLLLRRGFWVMAGLAGACCLPMMWWNIQHDWVNFRHVSGQAGMQDAGGVRWLGPLAYIGTQAGLLVGFWFVAWLAALVSDRPPREADPRVRFLWWMSVPTFAFFGLFSLRTAEEPNWPVTAYISGMVLATAWVVRQVQSARPGYQLLARGCLAAACALGLAVTLVMHDSSLVQPLLARISGPASRQQPLPLRRFDPTCRLRGWRTLAGEVDRIRTRLRRQGIEPVLAGARWNLPGELAFYCEGHPTVYSLGLAMGDRHSQYDLWRPNPVQDPQAFAGRTVVFVGDLSPALRRAFESLESPQVVVHREGGQPVAMWTVTVCRGFRRFEPLAAGARW